VTLLKVELKDYSFQMFKAIETLSDDHKRPRIQVKAAQNKKSFQYRHTVYMQ